MNLITHPTVQELIEWLQALDTPTAKVQLVDPDTGWILKPTFSPDRPDNVVDITASYYPANEIVKRR